MKITNKMKGEKKSFFFPPLKKKINSNNNLKQKVNSSHKPSGLKKITMGLKLNTNSHFSNKKK